MRGLVFWVSTIVLSVILTGCSFFPSSQTPAPTLYFPTPTRVSSVARVPATGTVLSTPFVVPTLSSTTPIPSTPLISTTSAIPTSPTVVGTPSFTPTPGPPTATPTPAPGEQTLEAAQNVDQALIAFAKAQATGDTGAILQAQQKLLDAANAAAPIAEADQTSYGQQLRSALDAVQGASTGSFDKLNDAHKTLVTIEGSSATPVVIPQPQNQPQQNLPDVAQNLRRAVQAYIQANNNGSRGDLLSAQRDLLTAVANAEAATKNVPSPAAQQIQTALTAIHDGLAGDAGKFQDALTALSGVNNQSNSTATASPSPTPSPSVTPTPTPSATPSPTVSPNASVTGSPVGSSGQHVDLQPLQNAVDNALQGLQNEQNDQNKDNVRRAQDDLRQAIQKASDAISDDHTPAADKLRDALGTAQAAASGDFTKIQTARDQLKAALTGQ
jgi:hypothetical protein